MATMTLCSYAALARLPLGSAATIEYLGPFIVAIAYRRASADLLSAALALLGVALIAGPSLGGSAAGVGYATATAGALGAYIALQASASVGGQLDNLSTTISVAALLTLPFAIQAAPRIAADDALRLSASCVLGVVLAYALDAFALRRVGGRRASVLLSFDPALAAICGFVILDQALCFTAKLGVLTVVTAGLIAASPWAALLALSLQPEVIGRYRSATRVLVLCVGAAACALAYRARVGSSM